MTVVPEPGAPAPTDPSASTSPVSVGDPGSSQPTGHQAVDAALAELDAAADLDPAQQVPVYEQAHRALSQTLAAIDQS